MTPIEKPFAAEPSALALRDQDLPFIGKKETSITDELIAGIEINPARGTDR